MASLEGTNWIQGRHGPAVSFSAVSTTIGVSETAQAGSGGRWLCRSASSSESARRAEHDGQRWNVCWPHRAMHRARFGEQWPDGPRADAAVWTQRSSGEHRTRVTGGSPKAWQCLAIARPSAAACLPGGRCHRAFRRISGKDSRKIGRHSLRPRLSDRCVPRPGRRRLPRLAGRQRDVVDPLCVPGDQDGHLAMPPLSICPPPISRPRRERHVRGDGGAGGGSSTQHTAHWILERPGFSGSWDWKNNVP